MTSRQVARRLASAVVSNKATASGYQHHANDCRRDDDLELAREFDARADRFRTAYEALEDVVRSLCAVDLDFSDIYDEEYAAAFKGEHL